MEKGQSKRLFSSNSGISHPRIIFVIVLVGLFGLVLGTLMRPAEAYQAFEIRLANVERRLDQLQFTFSNMDRRVSQLETQRYPTSTPTSQSTQTDTLSTMLETQRLMSSRIDELQTQLQNQQKLITELHKMIDEKQKPDSDDKKDATKKPATTKPKP